MRAPHARLLPLTLLLALAACRPGGEPAPAANAATEPAPPSATEPPPPTAPASIVASFRCDDLLVGTTFDNVAGNVTLSINGSRRQLPQAPSGSGARYADDAGNEFWNKGNEATLTLDGARHACSTTEDVSPWDAARARGVVFRAVGNEPGWLVEVEGSDAPVLRAQLDMGERTVETGPVERTADGFRGSAADGAAVVLKVTEDGCVDGMSGQRFPASAELAVGDERFRGCGAFLDR